MMSPGLNNKKFVKYQQQIFDYKKRLLKRVSWKYKVGFYLYHSLFSWLLLLFAKKANYQQQKPIDILFISNVNNFAVRNSNLLTELEQRKIRYDVFYVDFKNLFQYRKDSEVTTRSFLTADVYLANYILEQYQPKAIVSMFNGFPLGAILRNHPKKDYVSINFAHSILRKTVHHGLIDYDYFFVFGKSSINNMKNNPNRIGKNTNIIPVGSPFIQISEEPMDNFTSKNVLFVSQYSYVYSDTAKEIERIKDLVIKLAKANSTLQFTVKLHPHEPENNNYFTNQADLPVNLIVLPKRVKMLEALTNVKCILNSWSNSSLEAGALGIPSIMITNKYLPDPERKFLDYFPVCKNPSEIEQALTRLENRIYYDKMRENAYAFFRYHIQYQDFSERIVNHFSDIIQHKEVGTVCVL